MLNVILTLNVIKFTANLILMIKNVILLTINVIKKNAIDIEPGGGEFD